MNTISFYTPFYWNSDVLPHFLEHCFFTNQKSDAQFFFTHWTDMYGHLENTRTDYYFDENLKFEPLFKDLQKKINSKHIWKIKKVLSDEYNNISYEEKLFERILNKIYKQKYDISRYKSVKIKELEQYQEKYYKNGNWVLFDKGNNLLDYYLPNKRVIKNLKQMNWIIQYKGEKYKYLTVLLQNRESILEYLLFRNFANQYQNYFHTFLEPKYYFDNIDIRFSNDYAVLIIPNTFINVGKKKFEEWSNKYFEHYKQYVFSNIFDYYRNEWRIRLMLIFWEFIDENAFLETLKAKFENLKK